MKKVLLLLAVAAFSLTASGQFSLGPRLGVNFSVIDGKWDEFDEPDYKWITGPVIGIAGKYSFSELFSGRGEITYLTMGEKVEYSYEEGFKMQSMKHIFKENYHCIQLALLAQALFGGSKFYALTFLGPFATVKGPGNVEITENGVTESGKVKWEAPPGRSYLIDGYYYVDPEYNRRTDFGLYLGAGAGREMGPGKLELNIRLGLGLVDLNKFENKEDKQAAKDSGYEAYTSRNVSISLIYWFAFD